MNEVAVDEGGLRKEFFQLISNELLNPKYGMFKEYSESRLIWFNDDPLVRSALFSAIDANCGYMHTIV